MADDRKQELERLERELLADNIRDDDLLADIPIQLLTSTPHTETKESDLFTEEIIDNTPEVSEPLRVPHTHTGDMMNESKKRPIKKAKTTKVREDRWLITLMAIASFLCVGIIGVLIYWMEAFLK